MKHKYYITDLEKALSLMGMKMLVSYNFKQETLENGMKVYGWMEFNGELSAKCLEISGVIDAKEVENETNQVSKKDSKKN